MFDHLSYCWLLHKRCSHYPSGKQMSSAVANRLTCNKHAVSFAITVFAIMIIISSSSSITTNIAVSLCHVDSIYDGATAIRRSNNSQDLLEPAWDRLSCWILHSFIMLLEVHEGKETRFEDERKKKHTIHNLEKKHKNHQKMIGPKSRRSVTYGPHHQSTFPRWRFAPLGAAARDRHPWRQKRSGSSRHCKPSQHETFTAERSKNVQKSHQVDIYLLSFSCACM